MEQKHFTCDNCGSEQVVGRVRQLPPDWVMVMLQWGHKDATSAHCCSQSCAIEWVRQNTEENQ